MKRNIKILVLTSILLILTAVCAYAMTAIPTEKVEEKMVSAEMVNTSSDILSILDQTEAITATRVKYNQLKDEDIYEVSNQKYNIEFDSNNNLVGIYSKSISPVTARVSATKDFACEVIMEKYTELNLPADYELVYLEPFFNGMWEADFQKNYNGIYNKYEAVKTFFIPENGEICALTVFNEGHDSSEVSVTAEEAIQTAAKTLNIDPSEIVSSELTTEKANKTYNEKNKDKSIHTSWVLEKTDKSTIYVDATENTVIGGDLINE